MIKIVSFFILLNCRFDAIASKSITSESSNGMTTTIPSTTHAINTITTERSVIRDDMKPVLVPEIPPIPTLFDPIEQKLKEIFVVNFGPKLETTSAPTMLDAFGGAELQLSETGKMVPMGRRTNFRIRLNCRCVIHNRCARTNSCERRKRNEALRTK